MRMPRSRGWATLGATSGMAVGTHVIRAADHKRGKGKRSTQPDSDHTKARIVFAQQEMVRLFPLGLLEKRPRDLVIKVRRGLAKNQEWLDQGYEQISRRTVMRAWRELQRP